MKILIWKEWRELRLFILVAIAIIIVTRVLIDISPLDERDKADSLATVGLFLAPLLFTVFLGVIPFNNEFSKKTQSFLLSNAVSAGKIFWTKFFFGLFILLCLILLSHTVFLIRPSFFEAELKIYKYDLLTSFCYFVLPYILMYSAALFASLLVDSTLTAILCTPFILIFGMLLVSPLFVCLISTVDVHGFQRNLRLVSICPLILLFIMFGFLVWRNAISKGIAKSRMIAFSAIVTLLVSFGAHAVCNLLAGRELARASQNAKVSGIKLTPEEVIPPLVLQEENAAPIYQESFILLEKSPYFSLCNTNKLSSFSLDYHSPYSFIHYTYPS